jgi:hypothetical protein
MRWDGRMTNWRGSLRTRSYTGLVMARTRSQSSRAAFAHHVDEGVGRARVGFLNRLIELPRNHLVPSDPLLPKAHPGSIWVFFADTRARVGAAAWGRRPQGGGTSRSPTLFVVSRRSRRRTEPARRCQAPHSDPVVALAQAGLDLQEDIEHIHHHHSLELEVGVVSGAVSQYSSGC